MDTPNIPHVPTDSRALPDPLTGNSLSKVPRSPSHLLLSFHKFLVSARLRGRCIPFLRVSRYAVPHPFDIKCGDYDWTDKNKPLNSSERNANCRIPTLANIQDPLLPMLRPSHKQLSTLYREQAVPFAGMHKTGASLVATANCSEEICVVNVQSTLPLHCYNETHCAPAKLVRRRAILACGPAPKRLVHKVEISVISHYSSDKRKRIRHQRRGRATGTAGSTTCRGRPAITSSQAETQLWAHAQMNPLQILARMAGRTGRFRGFQ